MRVACIVNTVAAIVSPEARERLRRSIHLDGPFTDLSIGREYEVQALEKRDDGLWLYLHTVDVSEHPYPYPAELFELRNNVLPAGWCISLQMQQGTMNCKRLAPPAWANDESFYERLVEGDSAATALYRGFMVGG